MNRVVSFLMAVAFSFGGYYYQSMNGGGDDYLPENAPDGAIEYFESQDGNTSVALYEDRVEAEGDAIFGGPIVIHLKDLKSFARQPGNRFRFEGNDGSFFYFDLGFMGRGAANRFEKSVNDLLYEEEE